MKAIIINGSYTTDPLTIHMIGRSEDGKKIFYDFQSPIKPYFYARVDNEIKKIEVEKPEDVRNERQKYEEVYEADIPFIDRFLVDIGFKKAIDLDTLEPVDSSGIRLRRFSIDIETDETVDLDMENPQGEILEIGVRDYYKNLTVILTTIKKFDLNKFLDLKVKKMEEVRDSLKSKKIEYLLENIYDIDVKIIPFDTEREMLDYYYRLLTSKNYGDVNIGWNIGRISHGEIKGFDIPYIQKRSEKYGIKIDWSKYVLNFDLMEAYKRLQENDLKSFSLEYISQRELGIGKIKHKMGYKEMYIKSPEEFILYHYMDMLLVQLIDLKNGIFDFFQSLSEKVGSLDITKYNANYLIDMFLLHELHNTGNYLPVAKIGNYKSKIGGGMVYIAVMGIYRNVAVLDFSSEYPSIMETFNISHDTITDMEHADVKIEEFGYGFSLKKEGFIPKAISKLKTYRKSVKSEMLKHDVKSDEYKKLNDEQRSIKEITNAFYGVMGNATQIGENEYRYARLYNPNVQKAITYLTRMHINHVAEFVKKLGYEVLYGDTDSVMIHKLEWENSTVDDVVKEVTELQKKVNASFPEFVEKYGGDPEKSTLDMKFEKVYSSWIQVGAKKNYSGRIAYKDGSYIKPYTEYKGMSPRRSDKSDYTEKFVTNLIEYVHRSKSKAWDYYSREESRWDNKDRSLIEEMGIYISLNKTEYKTKTQSEKAVERSAREGIKLDRLKGKFKMYFISDGVIAINFDEELPKKYYSKLDWVNHKRRCFELPTKRILPLIKPNIMDDYLSKDNDIILGK